MSVVAVLGSRHPKRRGPVLDHLDPAASVWGSRIISSTTASSGVPERDSATEIDPIRSATV
jgi:hypothetical protein